MRYLDQFDKAFAESSTPFPNTFFNDSYEVYGADWSPDLLDQFDKEEDIDFKTIFRNFWLMEQQKHLSELFLITAKLLVICSWKILPDPGLNGHILMV